MKEASYRYNAMPGSKEPQLAYEHLFAPVLILYYLTEQFSTILHIICDMRA